MILSQVRNAINAKGYKWFEDTDNKGYDVNIVGVRNSSTGRKVTNVFDDLITISYKDWERCVIYTADTTSYRLRTLDEIEIYDKNINNS